MLLTIGIIILMMVIIVVYQSRNETPSFNMYSSRLMLLGSLIFNIFVKTGKCCAETIQNTNWNLTTNPSDKSTKSSDQ